MSGGWSWDDNPTAARERFRFVAAGYTPPLPDWVDPILPDDDPAWHRVSDADRWACRMGQMDPRGNTPEELAEFAALVRRLAAGAAEQW